VKTKSAIEDSISSYHARTKQTCLRFVVKPADKRSSALTERTQGSIHATAHVTSAPQCIHRRLVNCRSDADAFLGVCLSAAGVTCMTLNPKCLLAAEACFLKYELDVGKCLRDDGCPRPGSTFCATGDRCCPVGQIGCGGDCCLPAQCCGGTCCKTNCCGDQCVDTRSDPHNCGTCGSLCSDTVQYCVDGLCQPCDSSNGEFLCGTVGRPIFGGGLSVCYLAMYEKCCPAGYCIPQQAVAMTQRTRTAFSPRFGCRWFGMCWIVMAPLKTMACTGPGTMA